MQVIETSGKPIRAWVDGVEFDENARKREHGRYPVRSLARRGHARRARGHRRNRGQRHPDHRRKSCRRRSASISAAA